MKPPKVTIVGAAGGVGSALVHLLINARDRYEVALIGHRPQSVTCLLMDAEALAPLGRTPIVRRGGAEDFHDSDIIVVAASIPLTADGSRVGSMADNAEVLHPHLREISKISADWRGYVIVVTNPIDVFSSWLQQHAQIDRLRVLGYSWNDSLRLRVAVARTLGEDAADVTAWIIGEHGDACVPLFNRIQVRGRHVQLSTGQRQDILADLRSFYTRWGALGVSRTTPWTTAAGVARMIDDITRGRSADWTASIALNGEYGLRDVNLGVPVAMDAGGVSGVVQWDLEESEHAALRHAASLVRHRVDALGRL